MKQVQMRLMLLISATVTLLTAAWRGLDRRRRMVHGDAGIEVIAVAGIAAMIVAFLAILYAAFQNKINSYLSKL
jgi:hypothetical protein